jgi:CTP synthase (UTP-ammonia lyase)
MTEQRNVATGRLALVGNRSPNVHAHARIPRLLDALRQRDGLLLDPYWIPTQDVDTDGGLDGFDGIWLVPGSPYQSEAGALAAVRTARERAIPFLGTCGGFQHTMLEYARNVCQLTSAGHTENDPEAQDPVITPLECSLVGQEGAIHLTPGSRAERLLGVERTVERYHCNYGINPTYLETLRQHRLKFSGHDDEGQVRIAELPEHPFFLTTLFQPELAGDGTHPHALIQAFAAAMVAHRHSAAQLQR